MIRCISEKAKLNVSYVLEKTEEESTKDSIPGPVVSSNSVMNNSILSRSVKPADSNGVFVCRIAQR